MFRNLNFLIISFLIACILFPVAARAQEKEKPNVLVGILKDIEYSSRLKFEYDNNIFLKENDEDADYLEVFTQTLNYKLSKDDHYFQLGYRGNYSYYDQEATGVLGHSANVLYSYRPMNGFSIGIRDDFHWLQDSIITTTIADRFLSLGYIQNTPSVEMKNEISQDATLVTDVYYQFLDVRDADNDDYIDNKRFGAKTQLQYNITPNADLVGFAGYEHKQIAFPQISQKSSVSARPFVGFIKKFAGLLNWTTEVGFENINMDEQNMDDSNVDLKTAVETVFSVLTKIKLAFEENVKMPSLRTQYTQYDSTKASMGITHALSPKVTVNIDYSFERQEFNSSDALVGEAQEDKTTDIHDVGLTVSRKLNKWLTCDFNYDYTQRDTDFALESYTNHKYSVALTAKY